MNREKRLFEFGFINQKDAILVEFVPDNPLKDTTHLISTQIPSMNVSEVHRYCVRLLIL